MPRVECGFIADQAANGAEHLTGIGPTLFVNVGFDPNYHSSPNSYSAPQPDLENIPALIDTGALESCIDEDLAQDLALPLVDKSKVAGVGGEEELFVYMAQIYVPSLGFTQHGLFTGVRMNQGGQAHKALIGRTFLNSFIMIYDGFSGSVTLTV